MDVEVSSLKQPSHNEHGIYRGTDLANKPETIAYDFINEATYLKRYTSGQRMLFIVDNTTDLVPKRVSQRLKLPAAGKCTFIESTCMINLREVCNGVVAAIQVVRDGPFKLAAISALFDMRKDGQDLLQYFEWNGSISQAGHPDCFDLTDWNQMKCHFVERTEFVSNIHAAYFINQVRGTVPMNGTICPATRNEVDGGIQCSPLGPDVWKLRKPEFDHSLGITFEDCKIKAGETGHSNLLVLNKALDKPKKRRKILNVIPNSEHEDTKNFHVPPKKVKAHDQLGLVIVIKDSQHNNIKSSFSIGTPSSLKDRLNFGSLGSLSDSTSPLQKFFCLSESNYDKLCQDYRDGLEVGEDYEATIDCILAEHSSATHSLFSTDNVKPESCPTDTYYDGFVRIFAGDGSPPVDDSFNTCSSVDGFVIQYKFVAAREFSEFIPLSIAFYDSTIHGIKIMPWFIPKLEKCLGKCGIYNSRTTMVNKGHQSYIGQRKTDKQRQPTVSEGPVEQASSDCPPRENGFIYYRQRITALSWAFVLSLMSFLGGVTSIAPYYFYHHLAKLYQFANDSRHNIRFCTIAILTIDFCCSCHSDLNDLQDWCLEDMKKRLRNIIRNFERLRAKGVSVHSNRLDEARASLQHILWWGVSVPTTCCYQYVTKRNNVEVYQWFMCPGLGTTHRIRNYWVHIMLASLFSHCTSAPIYIVDGKAYFGSCPCATMFAWGGT